MDPRQWRQIAQSMFGEPPAGDVPDLGADALIAEASTSPPPSAQPSAAGADAVPFQGGPRDPEPAPLAAATALRLLVQLQDEITIADGPAAILHALCQMALQVDGCAAAVADLVGRDGTIWRCAAAGDSRICAAVSASQENETAASLGGSGVVTLVSSTGVAHWSPDFLRDPAATRWHAAAAVSGIRASASLPVRSAGRVVAVVTLFWRQRHRAEPAVTDLLSCALTQVGSRLESLEQRERLHRLADEQADVAASVVRIHELECARVAANICDDAMQLLAAMDLRLGLLQQRTAATAPQLDDAVAQVHALVAGATEGLRELLIDLEPADVDVAFNELVRDAAAQVFERTPVRVHFEEERPLTSHGRPPGFLGAAVRSQGLRVLREALLDARDHVGLTSVQVSFQVQPDGLQVVVSDDGDPGGPPWATRRVNAHPETMHLRAAVVGGRCTVQSSADDCTVVTLWLPYRNAGGQVLSDGAPSPRLRMVDLG